MYSFSKHVATFAATAVLLFAHADSTSADPIRIFVGEQNINGGGIVGNPNGGVDSATIDAHACHPCEVGQTTSFAGFMGGTFFGTLQAEGRTFELGGFNASFLSLTLTTPAFLLRPRIMTGLFSVNMPFEYSALLSFEDSVGDDRFERREFGFGGSGRVIGSFGVAPLPEVGGTQINFMGATYEVGAPDPTPEPGSVILLSTGLGGVLIRNFRRRVRAKRLSSPAS